MKSEKLFGRKTLWGEGMKKITTGFVMSVVGSVVLLLQVLGIGVDAPFVTEIAGSVCAVLVVLGIVVASSGKAQSDSEDSEETAEQNGEATTAATEKGEMEQGVIVVTAATEKGEREQGVTVVTATTEDSENATIIEEIKGVLADEDIHQDDASQNEQ